GTVRHDNRLLPAFAHLLCHCPCDEIDRAARWERRDDDDGFLGIVLRVERSWEQQKACDRKEPRGGTPDHRFHFMTSAIRCARLAEPGACIRFFTAAFDQDSISGCARS